MRLLLLILPIVLLAQELSVKQLFSVQTTKVHELKSSKEKRAYGYVKEDDARVYSLSPRFGGYVVKLYADRVYSYVKKGEKLALVYSPEVYKAKEDYLNSYNYTKTRANSEMLKSAKLKLSLLGVDSKEINAIIKNKKVSKYTTIYAPQNGYIFSKSINSGSAFNAKSELFKIVNLVEVWVEVKILQEDISMLANIESFELYFKGVNEVYKVTSPLLYPELNPKEVTLTLRLQVKNSGIRLFPGMYASVVLKAETQNYLTLPSSAVIRKNGNFYVFMVGEFKGEYEPREVSAKVLDNDTYIIEDGLNVDDEVIDNALFMLDSDAQINALY